MCAYAALALLGAIFLTGQIRAAVWMLLGALAVKTVIVVLARRHEE